MKDVLARIISNRAVAEDIFALTLEIEEIEDIRAGQFLTISTEDSSLLLRRPFCIESVNGNLVTVYYQIVGEGTRRISLLAEGSFAKVLYPLGNSFVLPSSPSKILLIGGGMGSVLLPMIINKNPTHQYHTFLGFQKKSKAILCEELTSLSESFFASTNDGSYGDKGFITDIVKKEIDNIKPDMIICCGPEVMYKALMSAIDTYKYDVWVSLERRMGCGIGACLVCNCKIATADGTKNLRACKDGPIFNLKEVVL